MTVPPVRSLLLLFLLYLVGPPCVAANSPSGSPLIPPSAPSIEPREVSGHIRFTYEELDMPAPEESRLGLLGFNFLGDLKYGFYGGIAGYGALKGERGGFFTGGLTGGKTIHIASRLHADAGLFVGGGGGGAAPQGGGLMLRGHAGLLLDLDSLRVGASASRVEFPNGDIESDQFSLNVDIPFSFLLAEAADGDAMESFLDDAGSFGIGQQDVFLKTQNYFPDSDSESTSGRPLDADIQTLGFEFRNYMGRRSYWHMETSGALGGNADGYAEVLFGLGHAKYWGGRTFGIEAALSAGGAGGGRVDTGGGAVAKARVGATLNLNQAYLLALDGTYMETLDGGRFSALGAGLRIGWRMRTAVRDGSFSLKKGWRLEKWQVAVEHQGYLDPQRKSFPSVDRDVRLISMQFRRYFDGSNCFFTGQAAGAYEGEAGGYASGLIGPGIHLSSDSLAAISFHSEILLGAGGGGGLDVGSGLLVQPVVGLSYRFTPSLAAGLSFGHVWAPDGELGSSLIGLNISTPFVLPTNSTSR